MKYFILVVIVFFCARCFSQGFDYYYVDEYIRATEDPDYTGYLKQKQADAQSVQNGVDDYKEELKYDAWLQEQQRREHLEELSWIRPEDTTKAEQDHEVQLAKDQKRHEDIQRGYATWKENNKTQKWARKDPERMIASLPTFEKIPKPKRKFKFKNPSKK